MAIAGALLCVLRARFFRFDVRRFGTAIAYQSIRKVRLLVRFGAQGLQRIQTAVGFGRAFARTGVHVRSAARTNPCTIIPAHSVIWHSKQPLLTHRGPEVDLPGSWPDLKYVRIILVVRQRLRENQIYILRHRRGEWYKASAAKYARTPLYSPTPVEPIRTCARQTSCHVNGIDGHIVAVLPDSVIRRKPTIHDSGSRIQSSYVKGQHSHETYLVTLTQSSHKLAESYVRCPIGIIEWVGSASDIACPSFNTASEQASA